MAARRFWSRSPTKSLANILKNFNAEPGFAGSFPDQDLALLEDNPDLIRDLRKQIEDQTQTNNPALESLRQFMATTPSRTSSIPTADAQTV